MNEWIEPGAGIPLSGAERFRGIDASVEEFWAYAMRDLRTNTTRGLLAEWLVLRAVGASEIQPEWAPFDVLTSDGTKIEVKSSGYLQSWGQAHHSVIRFDRLRTRAWDPKLGDAEAATFNAHVYVFCVQTAQDHEAYDPLDVGQWDFYVLPAVIVRRIDQKSIGLTGIVARTPAVPYRVLAEAIQAAAARNAHPEHGGEPPQGQGEVRS